MCLPERSSFTPTEGDRLARHGDTKNAERFFKAADDSRRDRGRHHNGTEKTTAEQLEEVMRREARRRK